MGRCHAILVLVLCSPSFAQESTANPLAKKLAALIVQLEDDKHWDAAAGKLVLIGKRAATALGAALENATEIENHDLAGRIIKTLERMGVDAKPALPSFWRAFEDAELDNFIYSGQVSIRISIIGDRSDLNRLRQILRFRIIQDRKNRKRLINAFQKIPVRLSARTKTNAGLSIKELNMKLASEPGNWIAVSQLLGRRGALAKVALPALLEVLITCSGHQARTPSRPPTDVDPSAEGRTAAEAILAIDPRSEEAAFAYAYMMNYDTLRWLRLRSARELAMLGQPVERALPMLVTCMRRKHQDPEILGTVLNCLAMIGKPAKRAIPDLEVLSKSKDQKIANRAKAVLKRVRGTGN